MSVAVIIRTTAAAALLTSGLACGGGGERLTTSEFIEQADSACERFDERVERTATPRPKTALDGIGRLISSLDEYIAQLREIQPPERLDSKYQSYISLIDKERERAKKASSDERSAQRYLDAEPTQLNEAGRIATDLGLSDCF